MNHRHVFRLALLCSGGVIFPYPRGAQAETITLRPEGAPPTGPTGKDSVWQPRPEADKPTWGLPGNTKDGKIDRGAMWWDSFPGASGRYKVTMSIILDGDIAAKFRFFVGKDAAGAPAKVAEGVVPRLTTVAECVDDKVPGTLELGEFDVKKGDAIRFWAESAFCKRTPTRYSGNAARFWEINFAPVAKSSDPPGGKTTKKPR